MTITDELRAEYTERVRLGAEHLDRSYGAYWPRQINVDKLDLFHDCQCILGQLHGDFGSGLEFEELTEDEAIDFGLLLSDEDIPNIKEGYELLTELWKSEILKRRGTLSG